MRKFQVLLAIALVCVSCGERNSRPGNSITDPETRKDTVYPLGFLTDTLIVKTTEILSGEVFSTLFSRLGMPGGDIQRLVRACDPDFDVNLIRLGAKVDAYYAGDSTSNRLAYAVYHKDRISSTVFRCQDSIALWEVRKQVDTVSKFADVVIETSLWNDLINAGGTPELTMNLADIFAWTVNFFGLQKGDRFRIFYDERDCEGENLGVLGVNFVEFKRGADSLYAVRYDQGDNGNQYWNEKGGSLKKAFLKAPLKFTRISSGFTYHRLHPIHGVVKPHTAVDYAAPSGTPVHALGDGTVNFAGWNGGGGNTIKIVHNSTYTTGYLHLRNFAPGIKKGSRVSQGQVIGYVGMTGTATGPHLDFRVWKNGTPVDPLKLESPSAEPIKESNKAALDSVYRMYKAKLDSLGN